MSEGVGRDAFMSAAEHFGEEVRALRESKGMSQVAFATEMHYKQAQISKVENGTVLASEAFASAMDRVAGTPGVYVRLRVRLIKLGHPSWFRPYVELEERATSVRMFNPVLVPGLVQTPDYAAGVLREGRPEDLDGLVTARIERQKILVRDRPTHLWLVLHERALRNMVGDRAVMHAQLVRLQDLAATPVHRVQLVRDDGWQHGPMASPFGLLSFEDRADVAHVDGFPRGYVLTEPTDVQDAHDAYDLLKAMAASPDVSAEVIESILKDYA
ncbi:Scr1 family TA system antitoxin-like transcriptional regulator [Streptomyces acidiscabies]|uniref:helix-turn-helix domain-containing protein n=1 Tax=Streptomyces acidiscabies TaxID=42234 RepID=UPI0038F7B10F